ncbi:hypothetical protein AB9K41_30200, partial [Cribrihabitans sp. XS_ASV171]
MRELKIGHLGKRFCVTWQRPNGKRARYRLDARTFAEAKAEAIEVYRGEENAPAETKGGGVLEKH